MNAKRENRIKATTKILEFVLTQLEKEYDLTIEDIEDINLNNNAMYCKLYSGETEVVMLYPKQ